MPKAGPVIIISQYCIHTTLFENLIKKARAKNEVIHFDDPRKANDYLLSAMDYPSLIFYDIKMIISYEEMNSYIHNEQHINLNIPLIFYSVAPEDQMSMTYLEMLIMRFLFDSNGLVK